MNDSSEHTNDSLDFHFLKDNDSIPYPSGITLPDDAHILITQLKSGIGDFVLLMPSLRALREKYPKACIDLIVSSSLECLIKEHSFKELGLFDNIIISPKEIPSKSSTQSSSFDATQFVELLHNLRLAQYDAVLVCQHLMDASLVKILRCITSATRAKCRVGLDNGLGSFLNIKIHDKGFGVKHRAEYNMAIVEAVGAVVLDKRLFFPLNDKVCYQAHTLLWGAGNSLIQRPIIAMHPGCGFYMKARRWAPERFAQLADMLYEEFRGQLLLLGGPDELPLREQVICSMQSNMPTINLSGQENILLTAAIIKQCDLFIGNDSGLMHISAAVGTPTVGIFGLTNHRAWAPYTPTNPRRSAVACLNLPCMPCAFVGHSVGNPEGCATRDCLNELDADFVARVARNLLYETYEEP